MWNQKLDLNNFKAAKELAVIQKIGCMEQPNPENPFIGGNIKNLGPVVLWEAGDRRTRARQDGFVDINQAVYCYRKVV